MISLGIDIGLTGALSATGAYGGCSLADLPLTADKKRIDGRKLLNLIREFVRAGEVGMVVIEDVQPRPQGNSNRHGNTMFSQGSMMQSKGIVLAVCDIAGLDIRMVTPQAWKAFYGLIGQPKTASMDIARELYPSADLRLVKHHNRAEALLMARYGLRKLVQA